MGWSDICQTALPVLSTSAQRSHPCEVLLNSASINAGVVGDGGGDREEDHAGNFGSDKLVNILG